MNKGMIFKGSITWYLIGAILRWYPVVPSWIISCAGILHCHSADRNLRHLRAKHGVEYKYNPDTKQYSFRMTPKRLFESLLREAK